MDHGRMSPAKWQRRARRALLWGLAGFALGQLLLLVASETCLRVLRDPVFFTRLALLRDRQRQQPPPKTVVALGTSRTEGGLLGRQIDRRLLAELGEPTYVSRW